MEDMFLERKAYSDVIERRILSLKDGYRQNIALIGDELAGKTSIIYNLLNKCYDNRIVTIYLEIRPESLDDFARRFIGVLLYNFLSASGAPLKEDLDFLIKRASGYIPKTIEKIKFILSSLEKRKRKGIFSEVLSLCEILNQETQKFCVVIFDEFHNLGNIGVKNLYSEWSKLLIVQKNTMYIIISSLKFKARAILSKGLSLLFGNFEILTVEPFDISTSEHYLERKLKGTDLNKGLKNFVINFTGGCPFYLKVISDALLKGSRSDLAEAIEDLLFEDSGILSQRFSNYIKRFFDSRHSQDYISILYLIASGHNKLKEIAHMLHQTRKELDVKINYLLEIDTITRSGNFLKINDRVFAFWLKFVHQEKLHSLSFDAKNQKSLFRENIEGMINEFLAHARKPITQRMTELLRLFEDGTIQIEKKPLRLVHFREIKPLEFNKGDIKLGLIGRSSEALWIMAFKQESLTEEDVLIFAKECKKYRHKMQKKIIIALRGLDTNAKLRALEERILTWDINNLNQILDLFSRPRVIA